MQNMQFKIEHSIGTQHIFELLAQEYRLNEKNLITVQRNYLDSFDWRLLQNSYVCGLDHHLEESIFFLEQQNSGNRLFIFPVDITPKFAHDIKLKSCSELLEKILGVRALMTLATINIKQRKLIIQNKEYKTIAKLQVESYSIPLEAKIVSVPGRLIIVPIKGYHKIFKDITQFVTEKLNLTQITNSLLDEVISKSEKTVGQTVSRVSNKLTESLSTWQAAKILLSNLLSTMQYNEQGVREAIDTEFLHDYRIAVRRTRSALSQIKHLFSDKELKHFKNEFYWLGCITTPTRDLDVYLLQFNRYMQDLPKTLRQDLLPLRQFLQNHWQEEHQRLCDALNSDRYHDLIRQWQTILKRKSIKSVQAYNAAKPAKQLVNKRIWKLYKKVLAEGQAIDQQSPEDDLHELRKTCKKFRYLMEFFKDYYPEKHLKHLIKIQKQLQDNLGEFQDLCVQTQQLNNYAEQMRTEGLANTQTIMAMGVLVQKLNAQKEAARSQFSQRFEQFTQPDKMIEFKMVFKPKVHSKGI